MRNHTTAVVTIASCNYFAQVKTLLESLALTNPSWDRYFALADDPKKEIESAVKATGSTLISLEELAIPDLNDMKFRYDIMEFNTAIKPFVLLKLLEEYERVVYLDPDICVYSEMDEVNAAFDSGYHFVVIPHLSDYFTDDGLQPSEPDIMRSGVYNFGFFAVDNSEEGKTAVRWWAERLEKLCINRQKEGIFVDQKWMDLLPGRHDMVRILRHSGYNVAYWNLSHRFATKENGRFFFNDEPLVFFHFSGYDVMRSNSVSKYQNRHTMDNIGVASELFYDYRSRIIKNDIQKWKTVPYSFDTFSDGHPVSVLFRYLYRDVPQFSKAMKGKNPFNCPEVFYKDKDHTADQIIEYVLRNDGVLSLSFLEADSSAWRNWLQFLLRKTYHLSSDWVYVVSGRLQAHVSQNHAFSQGKQSGVNLIGYMRSEHGLGESCRMTGMALEKAGVNWIGFDWEVGNNSRKCDTRLDDFIIDSCPYDISIFHINADQLPIVRNTAPGEAWDAYRIGIWYWELPVFPAQWWNGFELLDEIWAPSKFIYDCLIKCSPIPVHYIPAPVVKEEAKEQYTRQYFHLPADPFLFLNFFDSFSTSSRKNPEAAIKAFQKSFKPDDLRVGLVLKINNASPDAELVSKLKKKIGAYANIYIIAAIMTRDEINGLVACCDAAVSLHRSEGLGQLCQEAMFYGKPVIATNWSGNTDFMNDENSCLVDYSMVPVEGYVGCEDGEQDWAEADTDQAASFMLRLVEDKAYYDTIAVNAKDYIRTEYSAERVGLLMAERLDEIRKNKFFWGQKRKTNPVDASIHTYGSDPFNASDIVNYQDPGFGRDMEQAGNELQVLNSCWQNVYYRDLGNKPLKTLVKKGIRKLLTFLINPICFDQTNFNATAVRNINELTYKFQNQANFNAAVVSLFASSNRDQEIQSLKDEINRLNVSLQEMQEKQAKAYSGGFHPASKHKTPGKKLPGSAKKR